MSDLLFEAGVTVVLLAAGYLVGRRVDRLHYRSIAERERTWLPVPAVTAKTLHDPRPVAESRLVVGSVVVSVDFYKRFLMGIRTLIGGESVSYATLIDRARREALLRMKESCPGADLFLNCRLETVTIFKGVRGTTGSVEVVAYGTAVRFET
jgi:uncharacterized protein YbjQ (UPF0145 family)